MNSPQQTVEANLLRVLRGWREQSEKGIDRRLFTHLEHQLISVIHDDGISHVVKARPWEMVWRIIPRVVMVHHDSRRGVPGLVHQYDGDEEVVLEVECTDGSAYVGLRCGPPTDGEVYWIPADAATTAQTLHLMSYTHMPSDSRRLGV